MVDLKTTGVDVEGANTQAQSPERKDAESIKNDKKEEEVKTKQRDEKAPEQKA